MLTLPMTNIFVAARAGSARAGRYMGAYTMASATAFLIAPAVGLSVYERHGGGGKGRLESRHQGPQVGVV